MDVLLLKNGRIYQELFLENVILIVLWVIQQQFHNKSNMQQIDNVNAIQSVKNEEVSHPNRNRNAHKFSSMTSTGSVNLPKQERVHTAINLKKTSFLNVISDQDHRKYRKNSQNHEEKENQYSQGEQHPTGVSPAILEFQKNKKRVCDKIIRSEIDKERMSYIEYPGEQVVIVEENPIICSTDLYEKDDIGWKNRKMKVLTTQEFADIPVKDLRKIKVKSEKPMLGYHILRVTTKDETLIQYAIRESCLRHWFANGIWAYLLQMGIETSINQHFKEEYSGWLLKKSEFLGKWQRRFVTIMQKQGLSSAHSQSEKSTIQIPNTTEVWTRFQTFTFAGQKYLIIKLWQKIIKREFAVPIQNCISWLKAFCSLLVNKNQ